MIDVQGDPGVSPSCKQALEGLSMVSYALKLIVKKNQGYQHRGRHHEIYLNDHIWKAPDKIKVIIRQPIEKRK